jgi:uncharacterized phage protein gp47/JayE
MASYSKSKEEITIDALKALDGSPITARAPGTIVRSLIEVNADMISNAYAVLTDATNNVYLSAATGKYLDMIGALVGIKRLSGEIDNNLRYRINNAVPSHAKANTISVRTAAESISGVSEIIIQENYMGPGSFMIYVIPTVATAMQNIITQVYNAVKDVVACGTRFDVIPINYIDVSMDIEVIISKTYGDTIDNNSIINAVKSYLMNTRPGSILSIDAIEAAVAQSIGLQNIVNIRVTALYINGINTNLNYQASAGETFIVNRYETSPIRIVLRR